MATTVTVYGTRGPQEVPAWRWMCGSSGDLVMGLMIGVVEISFTNRLATNFTELTESCFFLQTKQNTRIVACHKKKVSTKQVGTYEDECNVHMILSKYIYVQPRAN